MNKKELFIKTLKGEIFQRKPVWFMRQAGRFLESYRKLREKYDFLTMCTTPELACEVTIQPLRELDVDAMILFSDILIPLKAFGANLTFQDGVTPIVENIKISNLMSEKINIENVSFVPETIKLIKEETKDVPLIGFAGAPFTLGCYLFGAGNDFYKIRSFIYENPSKFSLIMDKLADLTIEYLNTQIKTGVDAIQLFDSWAGILPKDIYEKFVYPFNQKIAESIKIPSIYYIKNSAHINDIVTRLQFDCLSVDWREDLLDIHSKSGKCVQGNLDNTLLFSSEETIKKHTESLLNRTKDIPHVVNLGHGVLPQTNPDSIKIIVDTAHKAVLA